MPVDDGTGGEDTGHASTRGTVGEVGEDAEVDGRPPDPSTPSEVTVVSDTGIADEGPITSADESTGPVYTCGDGVVDPGEACDDGNDFDGDGCTSDCTVTFAVEWTWTYDGPASSFDVANDVVVGPDGWIYVIGNTRSGGASDVWLQQLSPDGGPGWSWTWDGAEALADDGVALAFTPDGRIAIVGTTESMATGDDVLVLLFDPAIQAPLWVRVIDGPGSGPGEYDEIDAGRDVAIDPSGNVVVAARFRAGASDYDAFVAELSPIDGATLWAQQRDAGFDDDANAVWVSAIGEVALLVEYDPQHESFTTFFSDFGQPGVDYSEYFGARDLARRPDGGWAIAGVRDGDDFGIELVVATRDDGFNEWWEDDENADHDDTVHGVAAGGSNQTAAVGQRGASGQQGNAWIRIYRDDGTRLWDDSYDGPASLEDEYRAAAFDLFGGVIAVGSETALGQQSNVLVRKYAATL